MSLAAAGLTLLFGGVVGVASGLVGIGGGVLMVPFLYLLFALPRWSGVQVAPDAEAVVAHATSLFVIIPTALSALRSYQKARLVAWRVALPMALGAVVAAVLGARTAIALSPDVLKAGFGLLLVAAGGRLARRRREPRDGEEHELRLGLGWTLSSGAVVGFVSALMGVGGGIVAIPVLIYLVGLDIRQVAATSMGVIVFAAAAGVASYLVAGWGAPDLPPGTLGYVFLPAGVALIPGAVLGARWGAGLNQRLDVPLLQIVFAGLFLVVGLRLLLVNGRALVP